MNQPQVRRKPVASQALPDAEEMLFPEFLPGVKN